MSKVEIFQPHILDGQFINEIFRHTRDVNNRTRIFNLSLFAELKLLDAAERPDMFVTYSNGGVYSGWRSGYRKPVVENLIHTAIENSVSVGIFGSLDNLSNELIHEVTDNNINIFIPMPTPELEAFSLNRYINWLNNKEQSRRNYPANHSASLQDLRLQQNDLD